MLLLLGAAPDTGNQGVSALNLATISGLKKRGFKEFAVADHGRGVRTDSDGQVRVGVTHNRRLWRGDCLRTVAASTRFYGFGSPSARAFLTAQAVLDVSGGDSFTDLYGARRFEAMTLAKRVALRASRPLILLPQTLGPFHDPARRAVAASILREATGVWVRDKRSESLLANLLGDAFDPRRHHRGPDMAVLLPRKAPDAVPSSLYNWLAPGRTFPVVGLNVSGLLYQNEEEARGRYGLATSHRDQIEAAARAVLDSDPEMRLLLVSHVVRPKGDPESDFDAANALVDRLPTKYSHRVAVLPQNFDSCELKWLISNLDWFAGARMHATIGAFSSGVPTLGLAYSDKAAGVFDECGYGNQVADLRTLDARALAERVSNSVTNREAIRADLCRGLSTLKERAEAQMDAIAQMIATSTTPQLAA